MKPITHRASDEFDDRNHFLSVCLGLLSLAARVEIAMDAALPAAGGREADAGQATPARAARDAEDPVGYAFLGLLAVARRVGAHFAALPEDLLAPAADLRPASAPAGGGGADRFRDLRR